MSDGDQILQSLVAFLISNSALTFALLVVSAIGGLFAIAGTLLWLFLGRHRPLPMVKQTTSMLRRYGLWVLGAFVVWASIIFIALSFGARNSSLEGFARIGDSFGVLTSLFTGLGFAGLYVTLRLQSQAFDQQSASGAAQTFFRLLALRNDVIDRLEVESGVRGYRALHYYFEELIKRLNPAESWSNGDYQKSAQSFFIERQPQLSRFVSATQVLIDHLARHHDNEELPRHFLGFLDPKELALLLVYFDTLADEDKVMRGIGEVFASYPIFETCELPTEEELQGRKLEDLRVVRDHKVRRT